MNKPTVSSTAVLFSFLFWAGAASAGHIRCGVHLISDGQRKGATKYEVYKKCGQPAGQFGNTWIYEQQGKRKKVLRFNDAGQLMSIEG